MCSSRWRRPFQRPQSSRRTLRQLSILVLLLVVTAPAAVAETSLEPLAFISGTWRGDLDGGVIDEQWSAPEGNNMMGMFRYVREGKVTFYEMQSIELEASGPVLRIKHFHPGLRGWEEKDEAVTFELREVSGQKAVFLEDDGSQTLTFEVVDDRLTIELARVGTEKPSSRFEFTRQGAGTDRAADSAP